MDPRVQEISVAALTDLSRDQNCKKIIDLDRKVADYSIDLDLLCYLDHCG